jgi:hypothetical protein
MRIQQLVDQIRGTSGCVLMKPDGVPSVTPPHVLPEDLAIFYQLCGGATLFLNHDAGFRICSPFELRPANPIILGDYYEKYKEDIDKDISSSWYLIGKGKGPEEALILDLDQNRLGRCYDGFHQSYATRDSRIIATSFCELLGGLLKVKGEGLFWEQPDIKNLGFAYE